ncbi:MAG: hypothetical protein HYX80_03420 [Chloroflexi bacterium]|nr:hypothetical protein [Chloroflexota bacterium]
MADNNAETRQERREKKLKKKQERIQKHGKGLATIYKQAVQKRLGQKKEIDKPK